MKKRFIFDLDHTLINTEYDKEFIYFNNLFKGNDFVKDLSSFLFEYEGSRARY